MEEALTVRMRRTSHEFFVSFCVFSLFKKNPSVTQVH